MPYTYVKKYYGIDAKAGQRVRHTENNKYGVIARVRADDQYVHVRFDGAKFHVPCHPLSLEFTDNRVALAGGITSCSGGGDGQS